MLEQTLIDLESRAVLALAGICPRITRRTAQYLPTSAAVTLDVTARLKSEVNGSAILGEAMVDFWLTGAARNVDSAVAQDWAQLTVGFARERLSASTASIPELAQIVRADYVVVADNQGADEWTHVYRCIQTLRIPTRAGGSPVRGISVNTVTASASASQNAIATDDVVVVFTDSTLAVVGAAIAVHWANGLTDDVIELLDASDTVVGTHTLLSDGPGSHSFANTVAGTFTGRLRRGVSTTLSRTSATRIAAQGA